MIPIAPTVFWGPMAYTVIGGLMVATLLTLVFLPALYVAWFRINPRSNQSSPFLPKFLRLPKAEHGGAGGEKLVYLFGSSVSSAINGRWSEPKSGNTLIPQILKCRVLNT